MEVRDPVHGFVTFLKLISTVDYYLNTFGTEEENKVVETVRRIKPHFSEEVIRKALKIWKEKEI